MERESLLQSAEEAEQKEINLDESKGWTVFFEHATEAYDELAQLADSYTHTADSKAVLKAGVEAFEKMQTLVENSIAKIEAGEGISYSDSEEAQDLYNAVTDARDEMYELKNSAEAISEVESESAEVPPQVDESESSHIEVATEKEETAKKESFDDANSDFSAEIEEEPVSGEYSSSTESVESTDEPEESGHEKDLEKLNESYKKIVLLESDIQKCIVQYKTKVEALSAEKVTAERFAFMQLEQTHKRAKELKEELESGKVEVTPISAENICHEVSEVKKNLAQLETGLKKFFAEESTLVPKQQATGKMNVVAEQDIKPVPISTPSPKKTTANKPERTQKSTSSESGVPKKKPSLESLKPEAKKFSEKESLLPTSLKKDPQYAVYLRKHSLNWEQVERALRKNIASVEKISKFDSVLGVKHGSVFGKFLATMTIKDLSSFERMSWESKKTELESLSKSEGVQFDYNIYKKWLNRFDEMSEVVHLDADMTFAELCTLYAIVELTPEDVL